MTENDNRPRISVVMPVRDATPWLAEAIASIRAQSERDWELLAVDDGSSDASFDMLSDAARRDARIRALRTVARPAGIVAALNRGLAEARAAKLARMDADDIAHRDRLRAQADTLDGDPSLFAVGCRVRAFPRSLVGEGMRRYLAWQNALTDPEELARDRFVESPLLHPSVMMRTDVLRDELGGWREADWAEDWDLFLRAFEHGHRMARVPRMLLLWRLHEAQSTRVDPRYSAERFLAARSHFLARRLACQFARNVWVLGAGPVGKRLGKALACQSVPVEGFVDVDPKKIGGIVRAGRRGWPVIAMPDLLALEPRPYGVAAVGQPGARERIRRQLDTAGWREQHDYFVAA